MACHRPARRDAPARTCDRRDETSANRATGGRWSELLWEGVLRRIKRLFVLLGPRRFPTCSPPLWAGSDWRCMTRRPDRWPWGSVPRARLLGPGGITPV